MTRNYQLVYYDAENVGIICRDTGISKNVDCKLKLNKMRSDWMKINS